MIQEIEVKRLRAGTLFRLYFVGFLVTLYPFIIITGIAAAFGADTLKSGNVQVHGWKAVVDAIFLPPFCALFFSIFWLVLTWPGLWLFSKFKRTNLSFYTAERDHALQRTEAGVSVLSEPPRLP